MGEHHRVDVHIGHPRHWIHRPRHLVSAGMLANPLAGFYNRP
jgi:hypothetical protein